MRIHSDKLQPRDFPLALGMAGLDDVHVESLSVHRSQKRLRGFEVKLAAEPKKGRRRRNTGLYGAEDAFAPAFYHGATWDEHGYWMVKLFKIDPEAIVGPYAGVDDFHKQTEDKYR